MREFFYKLTFIYGILKVHKSQVHMTEIFLTHVASHMLKGSELLFLINICTLTRHHVGAGNDDHMLKFLAS
jgi:hypothetical protein